MSRNSLTISWRRLLSYRNQSIDLPSKSMDWFLNDNGLCHEKVNNSQNITKGFQTVTVVAYYARWLLYDKALHLLSTKAGYGNNSRELTYIFTSLNTGLSLLIWKLSLIFWVFKINSLNDKNRIFFQTVESNCKIRVFIYQCHFVDIYLKDVSIEIIII